MELSETETCREWQASVDMKWMQCIECIYSGYPPEKVTSGLPCSMPTVAFSSAYGTDKSDIMFGLSYLSQYRLDWNKLKQFGRVMRELGGNCV